MNKETSKTVVVPVDGSVNALRALDYLSLVFGSKYKLKVILFYLLPSLPPILIEESKKSDEMARKFTELEKKNRAMAQPILSEGKKGCLIKVLRNRLLKRFSKRERLELHGIFATGRKICEQMLLLFPHGG